MTYKIIRFHFNSDSEVIRTGLTLDEAQEHCNDPETSSSTSTDPRAAASGMWFDGYESE